MATRTIGSIEKSKRGCYDCADSIRKPGYLDKMTGEYVKACTHCPYSECPYTELDAYTNYHDYVKSNNFVSLVID